MEIPVIKPRKKRTSKKETNDQNKKDKDKVKAPEKIVSIDKFFSETVSATKLLFDIYSKQGRAYNEYAYTTIGRIRDVNFGLIRPIKNITEENLLFMLKTGEVDERIYE